MASKTFWLSFADPDSGKNLGVCIVDVTEEIADSTKVDLPVTAREGAEWIVAATRIAHYHKCNPGGEVMAYELTPGLPVGTGHIPTGWNPTWLASLPRNRLLSKEEAAKLNERQVS